MRITFIIKSPTPSASEEIRSEVERLREQGHETFPHLTFENGDAKRLAYRAAANRSDLVMVAGGDGTINEVVNGLHEYRVEHTDEESAEDLPRLGIIRLGTGNDLAAALEIPEDIPTAVSVGVGGVPLEVDVARVNERCFLNVSTGGFGAEATEETATEVKRALGPLAYVLTGAKKFVMLESSVARFTTGDELIHDGPFLLFAVGNSRRTGGGNWLTPRADLTDGLLDLCILTEISRVEFLSLLPDLHNGRHLDHPAVIYRQMPEIRIEPRSRLSVNADGEPLHESPLHYSVGPHRLTLMLPGAE